MSLIEIIPCLSDNYAYLIRDEKTNKNILVDAPEYGAIEKYLDKNDMSLDFILITHHHTDLLNEHSPDHTEMWLEEAEIISKINSEEELEALSKVGFITNEEIH